MKHKIEKEKVLTTEDIENMLGLSSKEYWFRIIHEVTRDAPPWALVRIQAIKR